MIFLQEIIEWGGVSLCMVFAHFLIIIIVLLLLCNLESNSSHLLLVYACWEWIFNKLHAALLNAEKMAWGSFWC